MHGQLSLQFMVLAPTVQIASLGMADTLILMVMALVVFGPRRLPQIGRQIGKLMYEFRKASNDFKFQMEEELRNAEEADRRKKEEERLRALALAAPALAPIEASIAAGTTEPVSARMDATATGTSALDMLNPAANYDNGPVASTQAASAPAADTAPTIMPPSIGETVAAARGWSQKYEQARLAEASKAVAAPAAAISETSAPESGESESTASAPAKSEVAKSEDASSEAASSEPAQDAAAHSASFPVNQHG
jgi:sec-independent protein translocase protein TatB